MKVYEKLVRDNIPQIMVANGAKPVTRILDEQEYLHELNKKLLEEVNEYLQDGNVEELADIQEVMNAILNVKCVSRESFEEIRTQKVLKRGAFNKKIYLIRED